MTFSQYHLELVSEEDYRKHGRITPGITDNSLQYCIVIYYYLVIIGRHQVMTKKEYGLILSKKSRYILSGNVSMLIVYSVSLVHLHYKQNLLLPPHIIAVTTEREDLKDVR